MTAIASSSRNPFRSPGLSPNDTGLSTDTPLSRQPPSSPMTAPPPTSYHLPPTIDPDPIGLAEEAPPAYTPSPDVHQGESTIEYGPSRPFRDPNPRRRPAQPLISPQPSGWSNVQPRQRQEQPRSFWHDLAGQLTSQLTASSTGSHRQHSSYSGESRLAPPSAHSTGGGWSSYPGQQQAPPPPRAPPPPPRPIIGIPTPPPRHPSSAPGSIRSPSEGPSSDFARDFYAAGSGDAETAFSPQEGPPNQSGSEYAPPPGPPPARSASTSTRTAPRNSIPDDGRPTKTPVPGHPLLNGGRLLVYPGTYECDKCHNTGYKQNDPSHPCRKCWTKYGKPFTGALAYTPFTPSSDASSSASKSFQRPLPVLRSPRSQPLAPSTPSSYPPQTRPHHPPHQPSLQIRQIPAYGSSRMVPPNAIVYKPGDPRIGGRMCWQCGGDGIVTFFLFEEQCSTCGGVGRVFP